MKRNALSWMLAVVLFATFGCAEDPVATNRGDADAKKGSDTAPAEAADLKKTEKSDMDDFVVHEWGTFTTFAGSNGTQLDFRANVEGELPYFVYDRAKQAGFWGNPFTKRRLFGRVRMETPVTYFYTDRVRTVDVSVQFPNGTLTEFYPPVRSMSPAFQMNEFKTRTNEARELVDVAPILKASLPKEAEDASPVLAELDWGSITLIPPEQLRPAIEDETLRDIVHRKVATRLAPQAANSEHYTAARVPDSAYVHVQLPIQEKKPALPQGDYFEKFLFYRGVGGFQVPVELTAQGGNQFTLNNFSDQEFRSLIIVSNSADGLRFSYHPKIKPGEELSISLPVERRQHAELAKAVQQELVNAGLYEAEAAAMVATWERSWFHEKGTRLFYLLPEELTDTLLPLTVKPAPRETVRVMVGRYEILTPEDEAIFLHIIHEGLAAEKLPELLHPVLAQRGRFAEPILQHLAAQTDDEKLKAEIDRLYAMARAR